MCGINLLRRELLAENPIFVENSEHNYNMFYKPVVEVLHNCKNPDFAQLLFCYDTLFDFMILYLKCIYA